MADAATNLSVTVISSAVALSVAALGIFGSIINERYKNYKARLSVAAVFRAEISAINELTTRAHTAENFLAINKLLRSGQVVSFPPTFAPEPAHGLVYEKYIGSIGLLRISDSQDIILFYSYIFGIRSIVKNIASGIDGSDVASRLSVQGQIDTGLHFWEQCQNISTRLIPSLERAAASKFSVGRTRP